MPSTSVAKLPVRYVPFEEITLDDWRWLGWGDRHQAPFNRINVEYLHKELQARTAHLLRLEAPARGVILIKPVRNNGDARLLVWKVAGVGIARQASRLAQLLIQTAREWGCSSVETLVIDPRLARAIMRAGARPESITLVLDAGGPDGQ